MFFSFLKYSKNLGYFESFLFINYSEFLCYGSSPSIGWATPLFDGGKRKRFCGFYPWPFDRSERLDPVSRKSLSLRAVVSVPVYITCWIMAVDHLGHDLVGLDSFWVSIGFSVEDRFWYQLEDSEAVVMFGCLLVMETDIIFIFAELAEWLLIYELPYLPCLSRTPLVLLLAGFSVFSEASTERNSWGSWWGPFNRKI